ncbi:MAG: hypothetical protein HWN66_18630 [Candidatus Helarchaeota archaeon]|nr:hypothetical protein [Candidatus Helarchaeota archaeon]
MAFYKKLSKQGKGGFIIFLIFNASLLFLLLSPYIPNLIGEFRDNKLLAGVMNGFSSIVQVRFKFIYNMQMGPIFKDGI